MYQFSRQIFAFQWCFIFITVTTLLVPSLSEAKQPSYPKSIPIIRNIVVNTKNVFDPSVRGEDRWPFTWANVIHFRTRPRVVLRELLVHPGEPARPELLDESERNLRALPFIKDARIKTVPAGDGRVDLMVQTQDTWTTQPQVNFKTEGGQSTFAVGIEEENLLGYGKTFTYFYRKKPDGMTNEFGYADPQFLNKRLQWNSQFVNSPFGNEQHLSLAHPFYSLETLWAAGASWDHVNDVQKVFGGGAETNRYRRDQHNVNTFMGVRVNQDPLNVQRVSLSYQYRRNAFDAEATTLPGSLPPNQTLSGPLLSWSLNQSNFIKETFIDKAERIEDINLGHQAGISAGYSTLALGSTDRSVPLTAFDAFGYDGERAWFILGSYGVTGRYHPYHATENRGKLLNTLYFANVNAYTHFPTNFPFTGVARLETAYVQNIDPQNQLQLGGDAGLRGFKVQSFTGNKSALLNLEGRAYYPREILHLAYLGGACFLDAGQVQPPGEPLMIGDIHASVGLGLRIAMTRSTEGSVFRVDVAYALGPLQQDDRVIVSVTLGQGFKRSGNTYGKFPDAPAF